MSRRGRHARHPHPHAPTARHGRSGTPGSAPRPDARVAPAAAPPPGAAESLAAEPLAADVAAAGLADTGPSALEVAAREAAPQPVSMGGAEAREAAHLRSGPLGGAHVEGTGARGSAGEPRPQGRPLPVPAEAGGERRASCTVAQLRRFIKSRPWVPMHELRRRFGINGEDDDVTPISVGDARLFVGLPPAEGQVLAELLGGGDVGYELSVDPWTPVVIGVYPMRPVPRT